MKILLSLLTAGSLLSSPVWADEILTVKNCGSNVQKHLDAGCKFITTRSENDGVSFILSCPKKVEEKFVLYSPWITRAEENSWWGEGFCGLEEIVLTREEADDVKEFQLFSYSFDNYPNN